MEATTSDGTDDSKTEIANDERSDDPARAGWQAYDLVADMQAKAEWHRTDWKWRDAKRNDNSDKVAA